MIYRQTRQTNKVSKRHSLVKKENKLVKFLILLELFNTTATLLLPTAEKKSKKLMLNVWKSAIEA
jgi:hypothetical protein